MLKKTPMKPPMFRKKPFLCKCFGHKWVPVYIRQRKYGDEKIIATYCERCFFGYDELLDFVSVRDVINTYNEKYFTKDK